MSQGFKHMMGSLKGDPDEVAPAPAPRPARPQKQKESVALAVVRPQPAPEETAPGSKTRVGKRNDPDYDQVTAYIRKETHKRAKIALLEGPGKQEFSELVEQLLTDWLAQRKAD